jgi:hypothetical protein
MKLIYHFLDIPLLWGARSFMSEAVLVKESQAKRSLSSKSGPTILDNASVSPEKLAGVN